MDRDVVEENKALLGKRWELMVNGGNSHPHFGLRLGMDAEVSAEIRRLDELQMARAADAATPLFRSAQPDETMIRVLSSQEIDTTSPLDDVDRLIEDENRVFLLNRWAAARRSIPDCQCLYGLSTSLTKFLTQVTLGDINLASKRGIRFAQLSARSKYFFHAGRHPTLTQSMRTVLATCTGSRLTC